MTWFLRLFPYVLPYGKFLGIETLNFSQSTTEEFKLPTEQGYQPTTSPCDAKSDVRIQNLHLR